MRKNTPIPRMQIGRRELPSSFGVLHEFPGRGLGTENRTRHKSRMHSGYWILRTKQKGKASRRGLSHKALGSGCLPSSSRVPIPSKVGFVPRDSLRLSQ